MLEVSIVLCPVQTLAIPVITGTGVGFTVTATVAVPVQPFVVTVTV